MSFDLVQLAMYRAAEKFGGTDKTFNGAGFSNQLSRIAGIDSSIDGRLVQAILCGRSDVEMLSGGSHYRIIERKP